ncbi:MAG: DUF86 domain-containing protein [Candidatus Binatia bacterium]
MSPTGDKDPRLYLIHMIECIDRIRAYTDAGREAFFANQMAQDAVYRNLQVLGEAAKRVPEAVRALAPAIPWRGIAGLCDVIVHQYEGVDPVQVWNVVENEIGRFEPPLRALI